MNELVVLKRGDESRNMFLDKVAFGPLTGWIGLKKKSGPQHKKNPFVFLEPTQEKLILSVKKSGWEIVEGLGVSGSLT